MNCLALLIITSLALYVHGHNNDQYLVCKPVSSAFESQRNETVLPVNNCASSNPRPGKRGARGLQGVKGPPGPPGVVDYEQINARLRTELSEMKLKLKCMNGVIVGTICYKLLYSVGNAVTYDKARSLCIFHGGVLAEMPTKEVYDAVYEYVKTTFILELKFQDEIYIRVWLGSIYQDGNVILSNGRRSYVLWYPGYPNGETRRTHMGIHVNHKPNSGHGFGMFNIYPTWDRAVPLCQLLLE